MMNCNTDIETPERHLLYQCDDGRHVVFSSYPGALAHVYDASPVRFDSCPNADDLYLAIDIPQDLEYRGKEIGDHEAKRLTGFYLDGWSALQHALVTLDRVPTNDENYSLVQAAVRLLETTTHAVEV